MHSIFRLTILCAFVLTSSAVPAGDGTRAVSFVLDCSASMSAKMTTGDRVVQTSSGEETRLDVAKEAVREALDKLSVDGDHRMGLILFGHRLAWEQGTSSPDLMEQTEYLEATLGFDVLKDLLPGDDVEIARHVSRFEPRDLAQMETRLAALRPWGEDPLYLALQRAVDTFDKSSQSERRLIVITDGGNNQGMAKHKTTREQVLESLDRRPVPVYIFRLGDDDIGRQEESELTQIARRSGGEYLKAADGAELRKHIESALAVRASRSPKPDHSAAATAAAADTQAADVTTNDLIKSAVATIKSSVPATEPAKLSKLQGSVSYYGLPAKRAKLVLEGEASQVVLRTDAQGNFSVEDVEPGVYTLWTEAIVKNTFRYASRKLKIDGSGATKTVDLDLQ